MEAEGARKPRQQTHPSRVPPAGGPCGTRAPLPVPRCRTGTRPVARATAKRYRRGKTTPARTCFGFVTFRSHEYYQRPAKQGKDTEKTHPFSVVLTENSRKRPKTSENAKRPEARSDGGVASGHGSPRSRGCGHGRGTPQAARGRSSIHSTSSTDICLVRLGPR